MNGSNSDLFVGYYPDQGFGGASALASSSATATAGGGGYPQDYGMGQGFGSQGPDYGLQGQQGLGQQGLGQQGLAGFGNVIRFTRIVLTLDLNLMF